MEKLKKLWPFDYEDITTWKYIDCKIVKKNKDNIIKEWVLNPKFKYSHLDVKYNVYECNI